MAVVIAFTGTASVQGSFVYPNFSTTTDLTLNGSAAVNGTAIRLTNNAGFNFNQAGSVFTNQMKWVGIGFDTVFDFRITNPLADGFAFVIQTTGPTALGSSGGNLGYSGIVNSVAIEFDNFPNVLQGDPLYTHSAVMTCGIGANNALSAACRVAVSANGAAGSITNGQQHQAEINYTPGTLTVKLDGTQIIQTAFQFGASGRPSLAATNQQAYVGFTGGDGILRQNQDIIDWSFTEVPEPGTWVTLLLGAAAIVISRLKRS